MWEFYANGRLLYRAGENERQALYDIRLTQRLNNAGELIFTVPPSNALFNALKPLATEISCVQDGEHIWSGRVVRTSYNMQKSLDVECEGALAYLSDVLQMPYNDGLTPKGWMEFFLQGYNARASANRRIEAGICTAFDNPTILVLSNAECSTTFDCLQKLVREDGVFFRIRPGDGTKYLDLVKRREAAAQTVRFGRNLLDFSDELDASDIYTIGYPTGKSADGEFVDISSVNGGSPFLRDEAAIALYGNIYREIDTGKRTPEDVKRRGEYLMSIRPLVLKRLQCSAVDLADIGINTEHFRLGDLVHVISAPHGIDIEMVLSEIKFDIPNVENTVYNIGHLRSTLTGALRASMPSAPREE